MDLSISVVSYNTRELLRRCLNAVFQDTTGISFEVYVVDNASRDGSEDMVRSEFPQVNLIANNINRGFSAANNQALLRAMGRYFLLLNSDTEVLDNALTTLVRFMDETPECGICCPQLYYPDGRLQISYKSFPTPQNRASSEVSPRLRKLKAILGLVEGAAPGGRKTVLPPDRPTLVERPRGACFLIRMACVDGIGPMDERFFMYCDEVDWALRAQEAGWKNYFVPHAKVVHVWGGSTSPRASLMQDIHAQSDYYYFSKHFGLKGDLLVRLGDLVGGGLAFVLAVYALVRGERNCASPMGHEEFSAFRNLLRRVLLVRPIRPQDWRHMANCVTLYELILQSAAAVLPVQNCATGHMPPGHNGPYHDPETPVRNTSHWLITFLKAYDISGEERFLEAARQAAAYLCSSEARPMGATFWHRKNPEKDFCNGLIGQAWTIEALAVAAKSLGDEACQRLAEVVFLLHPFNERLGLWRRVAVDGSYLSLDMTFNHQLWFAAAGALLLPAEDERVEQRIVRFMHRLSKNLALYPSGLIRHPVTITSPTDGKVGRVKRFLPRLMREGRSGVGQDEMYHKSIGYHAFNSYALALLKQQFPGHPFWQSEQMRTVLAYIGTDEFIKALQQNKYGYPYNPPGFEVAFALEVFTDNASKGQEKWLSEQFRRCYDFKSHMMSRGTEDPVTYAARLYEATRLPDLTVRIKS